MSEMTDIDLHTVLQVEDLAVSYVGEKGRALVVDGVSFTIRSGETFGLVGESGSGKTTTAMAILQLIKPPGRIERGRVIIGEIDMLTQQGEALRRLRWSRVSLIPQGAQNALNPVMKIKEQIGDAITNHSDRSSHRQIYERVIMLLDSVGLPARVANLYPHELSGGMKQRVCIAMAIALSPQLIVADEPTSALDVVVQRVVAHTLKEVQARLNSAVLLIGHDMGLQAQLVDRLGVMYRGRLVEIGPVRAIFREARHPYTQQLISSVPTIGQHRLEPTDTDRGGSAGRRSLLDERYPLLQVGLDHFAAIPA